MSESCRERQQCHSWAFPGHLPGGIGGDISQGPPFSAGDMLGDPLEMLGCESHPCLAFVSSEAGTVTAGHIPAGTGPLCDPADGDGSAKAPSGKALLQAGEF